MKRDKERGYCFHIHIYNDMSMKFASPKKRYKNKVASPLLAKYITSRRIAGLVVSSGVGGKTRMIFYLIRTESHIFSLPFEF